MIALCWVFWKLTGTIFHFYVDLFNNSALLICTKLLNYRTVFHWKLFSFRLQSIRSKFVYYTFNKHQIIASNVCVSYEIRHLAWRAVIIQKRMCGEVVRGVSFPGIDLHTRYFSPAISSHSEATLEFDEALWFKTQLLYLARK